MALYYCSFADPGLPSGQQFLGATIIEAPDQEAVVPLLWAMGRNPGGEVKFAELECCEHDLPTAARKYFDRFVPRDEVMKDG